MKLKRVSVHFLFIVAAVSSGYSQSTISATNAIAYPVTVRGGSAGFELIEDANRDLWLVNHATEGAELLPPLDGARGFAISSIEEAVVPTVWGGTTTGIFLLKDGRWEETNELQSPMTAIYADSGIVAVGTEAGLVTFTRNGSAGGAAQWVTAKAADEAIRVLSVDPGQTGVLLAGSIGAGQTLMRIELSSGMVDVVSAAEPSLKANAVAGPCYQVTPLSQTYSSGYNTGSLQIKRLRTGCSWSARRGDTWIVFTSATSGTGDFVVTYNILGNPSASSRTSSIIITALGDRSYTAAILQKGPPSLPTACTYSVTPNRFDLDEQFQVAQFQIKTQAGCAYYTSENETWITLVSGQSANGPGTVQFQVLFNSRTQRSGTIQIGTPSGKTFQVLINQEGVVR